MSDDRAAKLKAWAEANGYGAKVQAAAGEDAREVAAPVRPSPEQVIADAITRGSELIAAQRDQAPAGRTFDDEAIDAEALAGEDSLCPYCYEQHGARADCAAFMEEPDPVVHIEVVNKPAVPSEEHAALENRVVHVGGIDMVVRDGKLVPVGQPVTPQPRTKRSKPASKAKESASLAKVAAEYLAPAESPWIDPPELAAARKRGETNSGEKVYDIVLAATESQRAALSRDLASLQRRMGTRSMIGTLVRAVHVAAGLAFVGDDEG